MGAAASAALSSSDNKAVLAQELDELGGALGMGMPYHRRVEGGAQPSEVVACAMLPLHTDAVRQPCGTHLRRGIDLSKP